MTILLYPPFFRKLAVVFYSFGVKNDESNAKSIHPSADIFLVSPPFFHKLAVVFYCFGVKNEYCATKAIHPSVISIENFDGRHLASRLVIFLFFLFLFTYLIFTNRCRFREGPRILSRCLQNRQFLLLERCIFHRCDRNFY